jgi:AcrR family transcriptional regulator
MFNNTRTRAEPQRAGSEETRRLILDRALDLFRERGFDTTTLRDIAAAAGLSLGAAYYYFPSKEAIVAAYYDHVQQEHARRTHAAVEQERGFRQRLLAAFHSKIDIVEGDRRLLRALFRYGGDPDHALSWFGPATAHDRAVSIDVFRHAIAGEKWPDDLRDAAPALLWTMHMGILLYFLHDQSPDSRRTRTLIDAAVSFVVDMKRLATSPLLRPVRRRVVGVLRDAGLFPGSVTSAPA